MAKRNVCKRPLLAAAVLGAAAVAAPSSAQQPQAQQPQAQREPAVRITRDHAIDAYISEDALQAMYMRDIETDELGRIETRGGIFYNEQRDLIGIVDGMIPVGDVAPNRRLEVHIGPRMYGAFLSEENEDIFGIGVGGQARYYFNRARTASAILSIHYVPDILTFGAADNVQDVMLQLESQLRDGTDVYIGYRELELDVLGGDREVDDNVHLGFRRAF
jgi:hypothetical protein